MGIILEGYTSPPKPYDENDLPRKPWKPDPWDDVLPSAPGFLSDVVLALRGTSIPTAFAVWTAVLLIASAVKREAWLKWYPKPLYGNLYLLLVSPPRINKKSSCIMFGERLLRQFPTYMRNHNKRVMKNLKVIRNKATKEYIVSNMMPDANGKGKSVLLRRLEPDGSPTQIVMTDSAGKPVRYEKTSEAVIIAPELGVMVSKDRYNEGLLQFLLDVYDTHDLWESGTESKGLRKLRKLYTTFIGGTTPEAMRTSIPASVFGDGFLSRTAAVWLEVPVRSVPEPFEVEGAPSVQELARRLAWIAENTFGEFDMTKAARSYYHRWYEAYMHSLRDDPESAGVRAGMDVNLLKVAMWMHAQRYPTDMRITTQDIMDSQKLLERTFGGTFEMLDLLRGDKHYTKYKYVADYLMSKKEVSRLLLQRSMSRNVSAVELDAILTEMETNREIEVTRGKDGRKKEEKYRWRGAGFVKSARKRINLELKNTTMVRVPPKVSGK